MTTDPIVLSNAKERKVHTIASFCSIYCFSSNKPETPKTIYIMNIQTLSKMFSYDLS